MTTVFTARALASFGYYESPPFASEAEARRWARDRLGDGARIVKKTVERGTVIAEQELPSMGLRDFGPP
jgi:hypothetical protein